MFLDGNNHTSVGFDSFLNGVQYVHPSVRLSFDHTAVCFTNILSIFIYLYVRDTLRMDSCTPLMRSSFTLTANTSNPFLLVYLLSRLVSYHSNLRNNTLHLSKIDYNQLHKQAMKLLPRDGGVLSYTQDLPMCISLLQRTAHATNATNFMKII